MNAFTAPTVVTHGAQDPSAPLVVLLHGRGADERSIIDLAQHLPQGASYAAVRAPIAEGGGYAWFANRGIGRPVAESLCATMDWFRTWLDEVAPAGRPVVLVGFSGGAAFAGGLLLDDPQRYAGAAILYGTLPFDAGVPVTAGRLAGVPVFVGQGDADHVIPRELLDGTWSYLLADSGAAVVATRDPGGHQLSTRTVHELGHWLSHLTRFITHRSDAPTVSSVAWAGLEETELPMRQGARPEASWTIPQQQTTQNPFLVPEVHEFAHLHPEHDGSLHLALPLELAAEVSAKGWGRPHMWAGTRLSPGFMLVYGPRDEAEYDVVRCIVATSHAYATGHT